MDSKTINVLYSSSNIPPLLKVAFISHLEEQIENPTSLETIETYNYFRDLPFHPDIFTNSTDLVCRLLWGTQVLIPTPKNPH